MRNAGTAARRRTANNSAGSSGVEEVEREVEPLARRIAALPGVISRRTQEQPGRSIAIAIGAGYLLGGGLFSALTARIVATGVRIGLRVALLPFVTQGIVSVAEDLLSRNSDGAEGDSHSVSGTTTDAKNSPGPQAHTTGTRQSDNKETHS